MVSGQQHFWHRHSPILGRPRVARRAQHSIIVRIGAGRFVITHGARQQPHHRIHHAERRRFATREHEVADRPLLGGQACCHSLVHILVVAAEQRQVRSNRVAHRVIVREPRAARRQQHDRPLPLAQRFNRLKERLRLEHHPGATAVGIVIHGVMPVVGEVPELQQAELYQSCLGGASRNAGRKVRRQRLGKERHHVDAERRHLPSARVTRPAALPAAPR